MEEEKDQTSGANQISTCASATKSASKEKSRLTSDHHPKLKFQAHAQVCCLLCILP